MMRRKNVAVKASEFASTHYGWLMPDGKLYACGYSDHDWLARRLGYGHGSDLERQARAIKLVNNRKAAHRYSFFFSHERIKWDDLTQAQRDTIFDYSVAVNASLYAVAGCLGCPESQEQSQ